MDLHKKLRGKIEVRSKITIKTTHDISIVYTPGVAEVCREIAADREKAYEYTSKWNNIAIITDGTRTLGLGRLWPEAALPVMEGKALLYKQFGDVDAFPICLSAINIEEIITTVKNIAPVFGALNIEDIETPKALEIVERLDAELDIAVFHDDQHGTAIVTLAALLNAMRLTEGARDNERCSRRRWFGRLWHCKDTERDRNQGRHCQRLAGRNIKVARPHDDEQIQARAGRDY